MREDLNLSALAEALRALRAAEEERNRAWALAGSGLLDPAAERSVRIGAEHEVESARERVWRAKTGLRDEGEEKAWSGH